MLKLQETPADESMFNQVMKTSLLTTVTVPERQYGRYFNMKLTDLLRKETESAQCHNNLVSEIVCNVYQCYTGNGSLRLSLNIVTLTTMYQ